MTTPRRPSRAQLRSMSKDQLLRVAETALATRSAIAERSGLSFGNRRDTYKTFGYPREIPPERFRAEYRRDGLARRVVKLPAAATWRGGVEVLESTDPGNESEFERDVRELFDRVKMTRYMRRVDEVAALGRYAILVLGFPGALESPLTAATAEELSFLSVYSELTAEIIELDWTLGSPRFGKPLTYELKLTDVPVRIPGKRPANPKVHWSRVIHIAHNLLEDDTFGRSVLEVVFNRLVDNEKTIGATAEAMWKIADRGIAWSMDSNAKVTDDLLKKFDDQLDEYEHDQRKNVKVKGIRPYLLGSQVVDPRGAFEAIIALVCAATGIPQRILLGSERGQLASLQDRLNWAEVVDDRRENFAEPDVVRAVVDRLIELGALPRPADGYDVDFPPALTMTDDERATVALKRSQAILNVSNALSKRSPLSLGEIRDMVFEVDPELPDDYDEIEDLPGGTPTAPGNGVPVDPRAADPTGIAPTINVRGRRRGRAARRAAAVARREARLDRVAALLAKRVPTNGLDA